MGLHAVYKPVGRYCRYYAVLLPHLSAIIVTHSLPGKVKDRIGILPACSKTIKPTPSRAVYCTEKFFW